MEDIKDIVAEPVKVEPKVIIKVNEDKEVKDFTFIVPDNCQFALAKQGATSLFEHIVRLEYDAIREAAAKAKAEAEQKAEEVTAEIVG